MGQRGSGDRREERNEMDSIVWPEGLGSRLTEIIKTGIVLADTEGRIRFCNDSASAMLLSTRKDMLGKPIEILFLPDDLDVLLPNIMHLALEGSGFEGEALLRKGDGGSFFVNLSTASYRDGTSGNQFAIFAFQDITHLKEMEKEYMGSERFAGLGMMTDQISHQIRNPIVSIGGFALRLTKDRTCPSEYVQYTTIIHNEAKRLEYIIDRLVELARVHSIRHSPLTLEEIFRGARDAIGVRPDSEIVLPDPGALPATTFFGDGRLLIQTVRCVLQNSIEATNRGGEIRVTGNITKNQVQIRIKDSGEGIAAKHLPFVFDPFFTTRFNYLGLGLTLAKRVIETHKGEITIESEVGRGTEIQILLPRDRRRDIRTKLLQD
jgi:PAS domain S-box-containing protein